MHIAYIGLGSNLANPIQQVTQAILELDLLEDSYLLAYSSLYQSSPMTLDDDGKSQEDYINAVAKLATRLEPLDLLDKLQAIENSHERVREKRWGARTLDLDILLYDHTIITSDMSNGRLIVPHYGLKDRDFVLVPLAEINTDICLPDNSRVSELLAHCQQHNLQKLEWSQ
ncbi:MAG: 2-amino-4-hydroxy-6-hydroxymethyldihydropteridine diphosphokinase [Gammaproteobacteria bacterium]|nr:2-amino-4-hydroxy-6-hydroxymethyldihydropteridine diphosphokinase [Gammaproteobacteria bacterium]